MKRVVISGLICMAILLELLTFACCGVKNARLQVALTDYAAVLESNGLDGLRLSVYYIDPSILTRFPLTEERLLSFGSVQRFEVDNAQLLQNIELLKTINAEEMLMYGREAQSKTRIASPATIPKSGERNRKIHSCMLYLISI